MKKFIFTVCAALLLSAGLVQQAEAAIYILVDQAEDNRFPIAVDDMIKGENYNGSSGPLKDIAEVIRNDLFLSGYFFVIKPSVYRDNSGAYEKGTIPWQKWTSIGAKGLVKGVAIENNNGRITMQLRLFDTSTKELQMGKQYTFESNNWRNIAHRFADDIMEATTGRRGPFSSRIAYTVKTKGSKKKGWKQIYVMDMDGYKPDRLTRDSTYNLAPSWSPDGQQLVYASYANGFPDIYVYDIRTKTKRRLTANRSTNITPSFSPDGSLIAYSSGQGKDMELYVINSVGTGERAFSPAFGIDLAPSFSPDGEQMIFSSERGGRLHIYKKSLYGDGPATRITFDGSQNDSPDWSPDGTKVAFTRYAGGKYDVYTCNPDGSDARRLTYIASNEHPRWSPDSRYLTYSSSIDDKPQVYIMRYDGANKTRITKGKPSTLPDWGPWPQDYWE